MNKKEVLCNFIVIGSGIAGLRMAIELQKYGDVIIITKGKIDEGATKHAQGGLAAVFSSFDKPKYHFADTINAGGGICNPEAVWKMVEEAPMMIQELIHWGVRFDQSGNEYRLTKEGAHRVSRVLHSGGDATGANIENALVSQIEKQKIRYFENTYVSELIIKNKKAYGAVAYDDSDNRYVIFSNAVFIATGGLGQLYKITTNPPVSTGDGIYFSFMGGAEVMDMEFVQFHPTSLAINIYPRFLISEAVRGEGAVLVDDKGYPFMKDHHPMKDLAPRDVVARAIFNEMRCKCLSSVWLDISNIGIERFRSRFPTIYKNLIKHKVDLKHQKIPVMPSAHYFMGGIKIDLKAKTNIMNLFAAGEATSIGLHGSNRLASNSLIESLVFARIAGLNGRLYSDKKIEKIDFTPFKGKQMAYSNSIFDEIRENMDINAGIERCEKGLKDNLDHFKGLWRKYGDLPDNRPANVELKSMIINGSLISHAALMRRESRGAHFRSDFTFTDNFNWKKHTIIKKDDLKWIK